MMTIGQPTAQPPTEKPVLVNYPIRCRQVLDGLAQKGDILDFQDGTVMPVLALTGEKVSNIPYAIVWRPIYFADNEL